MRRALIYLLSDMGRLRECNLCGWSGDEFRPRLNPRKPSADSRCPRCGSLERHRLAFHALKRRQLNMGRVLHFAPEEPIAKWLKSQSFDYRSCDIELGAAMDVEDITKLTYADDRFDFIYCSNVLEHVPDDAAALREVRRVLASDGVCLVAVPIWRRKTYEDPEIETEKGRLEAFGQADHVRLYGLDIEDRLKSAGFEVECVTSRDFDPRVVGKHGMDHLTTRELFFCKKRPSD